MKKLIYLLLLCMVCIECTAQNKITQGEIKAKLETFEAKLSTHFNGERFIIVASKANKYNNGVPNPSDPKLPFYPKELMKVNFEGVKAIIYKVLNNKISDLRRHNELIRLGLIFKNNGDISDVRFSLRENTIITIQEIEEIDKQLRANVKATFKGDKHLRYEALSPGIIPDITFEVN